MLTYFTSSRGEVCQAAENIIVSERAPKCCAALGYSLLLAPSQNDFKAALQPHTGWPLEVQLSAEVSVLPATAILGYGKELKQGVELYIGLVHAHSVCSHAWFVSLTYKPLRSVSVNRKEKQLRGQEKHKIWMRPQESKAIHSCNCQLFSHAGRDLTVFLTYFERSGFATLETGELLSQNIVLSWLSSIN